ncbi:hypothetical protein [Sphingopyxis sp. P1IMeth2]|uniref:hypothetical protein n=1 Tax=unclassified Sphingopyxis TaxID=2614943 RepID=UPI0016462E1C|nr:hypothetical protein [Sphingopyxis sp. P1IMeth2]
MDKAVSALAGRRAPSIDMRTSKVAGAPTSCTLLRRVIGALASRRFLLAGIATAISAAAPSLAAPPPPSGQSQVDRDADLARSARKALDGGRAREAADMLETLVAPRHHMLAILPAWHLDLGRAYAALGAPDAAQGQYRLALAAAGEAGEAETEAELADLVARSGQANPVPDTLGPDGAKYFDLRWVDRGGGQIDYAGAFLLPADGPRGEAFMLATYRADCAALQVQMLAGSEFSAGGKRLRKFGRAELASPSNDLARHAAQMMCRRDPALAVRRTPDIDGLALLARYRAHREMRAAVAARTEAGSGLDAAACRAHVELFIEKIAAEGPVSGPSWQIRDWWDVAVETVPADQMAGAKLAAEQLARTDPVAANAAQKACVRKAIDSGEIAGL